MMGLILACASATASGQETQSSQEPFTAVLKRPIFRTSPFTAQQAPTPTPVPTPQPAPTTTTDVNEHQFGAGLRVGGVALGFGANVRYFIYGGPLGVQAEVVHYPLELQNQEWSAIQFSPSVIYRFRDHKFEGPARIMPYVGAGLSFVHSYFGDDLDLFETLVPDDTSVGVLLLGGVELFFDRIPNLGVSAELSYISNAEGLDAETSSLPWPSFVAAAHWYFW
jgi:hypothetical protein